MHCARRHGRAKGKHLKPPNDTSGRDEQSNLCDPNNRLIRKSKNHEYRQAYRPKPWSTPQPAKAAWLQAMTEKLASAPGQALYKLRQQTPRVRLAPARGQAQPVFGIIKAVCGFTRFSLRGPDKVTASGDPAALAYNRKRLHKLKLALAS